MNFSDVINESTKKTKIFEAELSKQQLNSIFMGISQDLAAGGGPSGASAASAAGNAPATGTTNQQTAAPQVKGQVNLTALTNLFPNIDGQALGKAVMAVKSGQGLSKVHVSTLATLASELIKADPKKTVAAANVLRTISAAVPKV
jgi:hypothetical protein